MILTEEEARKKTCVDLRKTLMDISHSISCMAAKGEVSPEELPKIREDLQADAKCTASLCPVWRWDDRVTNAEGVAVKSLVHGYCGLGGKP